MTPKQERAIESLRDKRKALARAQFHFDGAMRGAHKSGLPLREIADAAGVSHETVRRLIRSDQT